jgi:hypothetical protein
MSSGYCTFAECTVTLADVLNVPYLSMTYGYDSGGWGTTGNSKSCDSLYHTEGFRIQSSKTFVLLHLHGYDSNLGSVGESEALFAGTHGCIPIRLPKHSFQ